MSDVLRYPVWRGPCLAGLLEMNSRKMKTKIADAESVIRSRMVGSDAEPDERQAIEDALNALKFLDRLDN
jgi:hypothetical protein